jgi:hypothetical protein
MSPYAKKQYAQIMAIRYSKAKPDEKSAILDEFCKVCHYHRKYAITKLNDFFIHTDKPKSKRRGCPSKYRSDKILIPLKRIWLASNQPCSKRLKIIIKNWLPFYHEQFGHLNPKIANALLQISAPTIDRIFKPIRAKFKRKGISSTKPGTLLRKSIPIKTDQWNESIPGYLEADTLAHCGTTLLGEYVYSLACVDIATGWIEQRAVWNRGHTNIIAQVKDIELSLPFKILGFDSDNGGEFINKDLINYFIRRANPVQFTRSRPYHKDDNAHVEQKNWTHVRQWLGYYRFDNPNITPILNELYKTEWRLLHNFFLPSVKLIDKKRIHSKVVKIHDAPKTPYQRLLDSPHIDSKTKDLLRDQLSGLNPFKLRQGIEIKLKKIFKLLNSKSRRSDML